MGFSRISSVASSANADDHCENFQDELVKHLRFVYYALATCADHSIECLISQKFMIEFNQNEQQEIPEAAASTAKVIGVGGAGSNVVDRLAMESMDGAGLLSVHTDVRALANAVTSNRVQLGKKLTHGLGAGGDPEIGRLAALEAEEEIRAAVNHYKMVFVCAGLGGGTGSGAAPEVVRMAREAGAFVVAFITMPFSFEGPRRLKQANEALEEMRREANALITFDNDRMGELIVQSDGIQKAFEECDKLIAGSIRGVAALVTRPGLIKIGLDDLLTALRNSDSRCLFGSGRATGENRAKEALRLAINSPLLAKGKMFSSASNILVHITGGEDLRLHEIEGLMRELGKSVPEDAQLLFGAAIDPAMKKELCVTLFSSLSNEPGKLEETLPMAAETVPPVEAEEPEPAPKPEVSDGGVDDFELPEPEKAPEPEIESENSLFDECSSTAGKDDELDQDSDRDDDVSLIDDAPIVEETQNDDDEPEWEDLPEPEAPMEKVELPQVSKIPEPKESSEEEASAPFAKPRSMFRPEPRDERKDRPVFVNDPTVRIPLRPEVVRDSSDAAKAERPSDDARRSGLRQGLDDPTGSEKPDKKGQPQLDLEKSGEGRFAKSEPTIVDGEDLDTPAYLRKRKRR